MVVDLWQAIRVADLHGWILLVAEINRVISRDLDGDEVWIMYWFTEEKDKGSAIQALPSVFHLYSLAKRQDNLISRCLCLQSMWANLYLQKKRIISWCTHDAGRMDAPSIINDSLSQVISSVSVVDHI